MRPNLRLVVSRKAPRTRDPGMKGIELRGDKIRITFWYSGERCRETLNMINTATNVEWAKRERSRILEQIKNGTFRYEEHFPNSKRARRPGMTPAKLMRFGEYAEIWLSAKKDVTSATIKDYRSSLSRLWIPALGHLRAEQLIKSVLDATIAKIKWLSPKHRNNALVPLRGVLVTMFYDEATRTNLAALIKNVKRQKPEPNPLTIAEIEAVLLYIETAFGPESKNLFEVGFFTGVRPGELIALHWSDVDFESGLLTVSRSWGHDHDDEDLINAEDATKTYKVRHIELSNRATAALKRQLQFTPPQSSKEIFLTRRERIPFTSSNHLYQRVWVPTLQALNISKRRMYQMRHSFATMNLMAGANPAWIADQLGHTNAQLVFTTYGRWIKGAEKVRQRGILDDWLATGTAPSVPQSPEGGGDN